MPSVLHPDPFNAVLLQSSSLVVTEEQKDYIRRILAVCCSDTQFADKAWRSISHVLTVGVTPSPVVTSLNPSSVMLGAPSFDVHVVGNNFTPESIIVFAGQEEPTTFISATELTTGVNMDLWVGPDSVPVAVLNASGIESDPVMFTFTGVVADTNREYAHSGAHVGMGGHAIDPSAHKEPTLSEHHSVKAAKEAAKEK